MVNPSTAKGGTLTLALSSTPDSFDPGNTYYAWVLDFDNLFTMPLFTYKSCPGTCGAQVVPDLATDMGTVSNNGLTWTVHIQPNVKFEDGTVVTSQDVKYAIERTYDRSVAGQRARPTTRRSSPTRATRARTRTGPRT